eukprot:GHVS01098912.1.p1 GENE.GHVS01098912.1~~GHVS01098912.1.p1  ORF type:complete len:260 (-),score=17.98 GHVS01098912.1:244-993(-)
MKAMTDFFNLYVAEINPVKGSQDGDVSGVSAAAVDWWSKRVMALVAVKEASPDATIVDIDSKLLLGQADVAASKEYYSKVQNEYMYKSGDVQSRLLYFTSVVNFNLGDFMVTRMFAISEMTVKDFTESVYKDTAFMIDRKDYDQDQLKFVMTTARAMLSSQKYYFDLITHALEKPKDADKLKNGELIKKSTSICQKLVEAFQESMEALTPNGDVNWHRLYFNLVSAGGGIVLGQRTNDRQDAWAKFIAP